jgi:hypothetical protein
MAYTVRTPLSDDEELVAGEVISAALKIHRDLGPGYPERFYERAMVVELKRRALLFETEVRVEVHYEVGECRRAVVVSVRRLSPPATHVPCCPASCREVSPLVP